MPFEIGDKVRIKSDLVSGQKYHINGVHYLCCSKEMTRHVGKIATITRIESQHDVYEVDVDFGWDYWCADMFEPVSRNKYKIKGL